MTRVQQDKIIRELRQTLAEASECAGNLCHADDCNALDEWCECGLDGLRFRLGVAAFTTEEIAAAREAA